MLYPRRGLELVRQLPDMLLLTSALLLLPAAAAAPLSKGARALTHPLTGCAAYTSVSGSDAETSWCMSTCAVSDCPETMCKCDDGAGAAAGGASATAPATPEVPGATTPEVPGAATPAVPVVPGAVPPSTKSAAAAGKGKEAMEMKGVPSADAKPAEADEKDAKHAFDKLIIGYWGSGAPHCPRQPHQLAF